VDARIHTHVLPDSLACPHPRPPRPRVTHECTHARPHSCPILTCPFASPAYSLTRLALVPHVHVCMHATHMNVRPAAHVHSRTRTPTPSCPHPPTHALVMHTISPTPFPIPSPLSNMCKHAYTRLPAPLCTVYGLMHARTSIHHRPHVPPPSPSPLWPPSSHMQAITHKYALSPSFPRPIRAAYTSLVPHACTRCLSFWFVFLSSLSFILFYLPFPCIYHLEY